MYRNPSYFTISLRSLNDRPVNTYSALNHSSAFFLSPIGGEKVRRKCKDDKNNKNVGPVCVSDSDLYRSTRSYLPNGYPYRCEVSRCFPLSNYETTSNPSQPVACCHCGRRDCSLPLTCDVTSLIAIEGCPI